ncbi:hypothetical protein [Rhodococcus pyridinivorans]
MNLSLERSWIGEVPSSWTVAPLKYSITYNDEVLPESTSPATELNYVEISDVSSNEGIRSTTRIPFGKAPSRARRIAQSGDVLVSTVRTYLRAIAPVEYKAVIASTGFAVLRAAHGLTSGYLRYLCLSDPFIESIIAHSTGVSYPAINASDMVQTYVAIPPLVMQAAIADFLDCETAKIDVLIAKQEQLIVTLREDRAATITQAVTKGLDPNVEMKESEVQWMGTVPIHWLVDRIKNSVESARNGIWGSEPDGGDDDIRCVRVADFDRPQLAIHDRDVTFRKVTLSEREGRILQRGDLILEKSGGGDKNPVGFVVLYDAEEPAVCSNFVARVRLARGQCPKFWTYVHHCLYQSRLTYPSIKQNTGIQNLDQQSYFNERVAFPPLDEQEQIVSFLDSQCARIDALIAKSTEMIETLREYRSALITDAVTGKIDVRGAA